MSLTLTRNKSDNQMGTAVEGTVLVVDDTPLPLANLRSAVRVSTRLPAGATARLHASYRSQGLESWRYKFGDDVAQVRDFQLRMRTNFKDIDFADNTLSPTEKHEVPGGWELTWVYKNLLTGYEIGMPMPEKLQPGPLAGQISFFAPVSLFFFFFVLFILTTLDAGTRVGRFMLQDLLGNIVPALGRTSWYPSVIATSAVVVGAWGYILYIGTIDPLGGINSLWPLFGISNQMLAAIALCVGTAILVKSGKAKYAWVTAGPLAWLAIITTSAAWEKLFSPELRIGFIAHANAMTQKLAEGALSPELARGAPRLSFNDRLDAALAVAFMAVVVVVIVASAPPSFSIVMSPETLKLLSSYPS